MEIQIRNVNTDDIELWIELSREYDVYVKDLVGDLTEWYNGNENDISFKDYMKSKIAKKEVLMATTDICQGIVAFSKAYNRITFFAISHKANFEYVSHYLIDYVLNLLNTERQISINIIKSNAEIIKKQRNVFFEYGFVFNSDDVENGVPVEKYMRL